MLGAGGVPAHAFHVGVLAALAEFGGWDARQAALIIGTSAGSGVSALLRAGLDPSDAYAFFQYRPMSSAGQALYQRMPTAAWDSGARSAGGPLPASPVLALRSLLRWPPRPGLTVAGALPRGRRSPQPLGDRYGALHDGWPEQSLWLCAVRLGDGTRVVFGRDDHPPTDVGIAVQASSAVPGFFHPVRVGDQDYVDGGVWSTTNADLTNGLGFDAVVVSAPLSTPLLLRDLPRQPSAYRAYRAYHRAVLQAETRRVRQNGTPVITFEPTLEDLTLLSTGAIRNQASAAISEQAYAAVRRRLERDPSIATLLTAPIAA